MRISRYALPLASFLLSHNDFSVLPRLSLRGDPSPGRARSWRRRGRGYPYSSTRQRERYARNHMDEQQRNSHKNGTAVSRFLFAKATGEQQ